MHDNAKHLCTGPLITPEQVEQRIRQARKLRSEAFANSVVRLFTLVRDGSRRMFAQSSEPPARIKVYIPAWARKARAAGTSQRHAEMARQCLDADGEAHIVNEARGRAA